MINNAEVGAYIMNSHEGILQSPKMIEVTANLGAKLIVNISLQFFEIARGDMEVTTSSFGRKMVVEDRRTGRVVIMDSQCVRSVNEWNDYEER